MPCDNMHEFGLPVLYINGTAYVGELEGYHTTLFRNIMEAGYVKPDNLPSHVVAARIDRMGEMAKYDFDTDLDGDNIADLQGQDDELITILTNHWPELAENMRGLNGEETNLIKDLHWPNVIDIKELYDSHQEMLNADPSMRTAATKIVQLDTRSEHEAYMDRRPFIYHPGFDTIYIGNAGC